MKKDAKGITLIALVITIIVLLILATVSIVMLTGENGILKKATGAKEKNKVGEEKEIIFEIAQACENRSGIPLRFLSVKTSYLTGMAFFVDIFVGLCYTCE